KQVAMALVNKGDALDGLGQRKGAIAAYREAIRISPGYAPALNNLGVALASEASEGLSSETPSGIAHSSNTIEDEHSHETETIIDFSRPRVYNSSLMETNFSPAAQEIAAHYGLTVEDVHVALQAARAAKETAQHAKPRAVVAPSPVEPNVKPAAASSNAPQAVTAEMLFGDVQTALAKPRQKYAFPDELLTDPEALRKAESVANARTYKKRKGSELSPDEDARGKIAASFVQQAKRRQRGSLHPRSG